MNRTTRINRIMSVSKTQVPSRTGGQALTDALYTTKKLFKNPPIEKCIPYGNMMYDRRIARGTTIKYPTKKEHGNVRTIRNTGTEKPKRFKFRIGSPPKLFNRKDEPCQTEYYLEELYEHPPEKNVGCQTDLFLDRPDSPPYIPAKTGVDVETQIYDGELFDFDKECELIIEVIVNKSLEQAMIEVLENDEIIALQEQQLRYLELRAGEKSETQRLELKEKRLREEKDRRMEQFRNACRLQKEVEERVAAAVLTHGYLNDFLPNILEELRSAGFLLDNIKDDVEKGVVPWQWNQLNKKSALMTCARDVLTDIVEDITTARKLVYELLGEREDEIPKLRQTCRILGDEGRETEFVLDETEELMMLNEGDELRLDIAHGGQDVPLIPIPEPETTEIEEPEMSEIPQESGGKRATI